MLRVHIIKLMRNVLQSPVAGANNIWLLKVYCRLSDLFPLFKVSLNPLHPNISLHILHTILYVFRSIERENLFNNQELLWMVIAFFILVTLRCDSGMILWGEIRCESLLGVKGPFSGHSRQLHSRQALREKVTKLPTTVNLRTVTLTTKWSQIMGCTLIVTAVLSMTDTLEGYCVLW